METRPERQPWYAGLIALAAAVVIAAVLYAVSNVIFVAALLAAPPRDDLPSSVAHARTAAAATQRALAAPTAAPTIVVPSAAPRPTAAPEPTAATRPTAAPESAFTGPEQVLPDGTRIPINLGATSATEAHQAWLTALITTSYDRALAVYRAADGSVPIDELNDHMGLMYSAMHRPDPDPLGLGKLRDVREAGDYADPGGGGVRYAIAHLVFDSSTLCMQATLVDDGDAGWHVRAWGTITAEECLTARARIAADSR
ncbi:hypothetical protein K2Z83_14420 [Oscillochloris sp. ZM17-4]|uniref:hypothetical protein n=1 Tax=Oscillochloris sp. ZM17-4 TaxID=2866714 RepID=UPI001C7354ED|nr:hypothetical protein [Oscillochloris sp. ZM17-4]MBX0328871.1 hypothetical protein [Oscillochloris sp. ZM17-4]